MDAGFDRVDADLRSLRAELSARIDAQGAELGARIEAQGAQINARIDALQRTMLQVSGATIAAVLATLLSVIATHA